MVLFTSGTICGLGETIATDTLWGLESKENRSDISFARESIADVWEYLGEFKAAIQEREKSLAIQEGIWKEDLSNDEAVSASSRNHLILARLYERVGNKERAANHREQNAELKTTIQKLRARPAN